VYESKAPVGLVELRGGERIDAPIGVGVEPRAAVVLGVERGARIAHGRERVGVS
jgi:hypothetical protein